MKKITGYMVVLALLLSIFLPELSVRAEEMEAQDVKYSINIEQTTNGIITINNDVNAPTEFMAGETITINAAPDSGYKVGDMTVEGGTGQIGSTQELELVFSMPEEDITIRASFIPTEDTEESDKEDIEMSEEESEEGSTEDTEEKNPDQEVQEKKASSGDEDPEDSVMTPMGITDIRLSYIPTVGEKFNVGASVVTWWESGNASGGTIQLSGNPLFEGIIVAASCATPTAANPYIGHPYYGEIIINQVDSNAGWATCKGLLISQVQAAGGDDGTGHISGYQNVSFDVDFVFDAHAWIRIKKSPSAGSNFGTNKLYTYAGAKFGVYKNTANAQSDTNRLATLTTKANGGRKEEKMDRFILRNLSEEYSELLNAGPDQVDLIDKFVRWFDEESETNPAYAHVIGVEFYDKYRYDMSEKKHSFVIKTIIDDKYDDESTMLIIDYYEKREKYFIHP